MKRFILVLSCLSVLYSGLVWALEGCIDLGANIHGNHPIEKASSNHHHEPGAAHHSHSDPTRVHCPNVFGEFLVSSRVTLTSDHGYVHHVALAGESIQDFLSDMIFGGFGDGPPVPRQSRTIPRHLLLSVIRI